MFGGRDGYKNGYFYGTTYAEAGMDMVESASGEQEGVLLGAPGAWNWTGTVVAIDATGSNSVMTQPWSEWEPQINDYAGYALTSGHFVSSSQSRPRQLAIGAPRACTARTMVDGWLASVCADRAGTVFIVEYKGEEQLERVHKVSGRQTGEYFGAALASADIDGDGVDELVVGAPLFANSATAGGGGGGPASPGGAFSFEEGRVSVQVYDPSIPMFYERLSIFGGRNSARFGSAVANAGDLDGDGMEEIAVGAPFEDGGRGTVRIYYGKRDIEAIQG